jgi:CcmD family protein
MKVRSFAWLASVMVLAAAMAAPVLGQATELGRQTLGRPYWHFFAAYAIVVVVLAGWVVSIGRRLKAVERRLPDLDG